MIRTLVVISLLLAISFAFEQGRGRGPLGWRELESKPALSKPITFTFNMKQCNLEKLEDIFWDVSNPESENYQRYLTKHEVNDLVVCDGDIELVMKYLKNFDVTNFEILGNAVQITTTVEVAEQMLGTEFFVYQNVKEPETFFTRQKGMIQLPKVLAERVNFISGISDFFYGTKLSPVAIGHQEHILKKSNPLHQRSSKRQDFNPNFYNVDDPYVVPEILREFYQIPNKKLEAKTSTLGIAAFDDGYDKSGLCGFEQMIADHKYQPNITWVGYPLASDEVESDLDVQYSTSIARYVHEYFANHASGQWILDWAQQAVNNLDNVYIWSISYGWPEVWQCAAFPLNVTNCPTGYDYQQYINATNVELQKLGTMGVSVLVSSGDDGTPGFTSNCPLNANIIFGEAEGACGSAECNCATYLLEYTYKGETGQCVYPIGFDFDQPSCVYIGETVPLIYACEGALENFESKNPQCPFYAEGAATTCNCTQLKPSSYSSEGAQCTATGWSYNADNGPVFFADFPTSSPYVTSVGASSFQFSQFASAAAPCDLNYNKPEIYCSAKDIAGYSGGGGFSNVQPMPSYQSSVVQKYLQTAPSLPPSFSYNPANRAYPDVAFNGHNFLINMGINVLFEGGSPTYSGEITPVGGTSASSPSFAGIVAHLNDYLLSNKKSTLGFLNPLLYQMSAKNPKTFNDIVPHQIEFLNVTFNAGSFTGCTEDYCCDYGFEVAPGWDPATGLGSPVYPEMLAYIKNMFEGK